MVELIEMTGNSRVPLIDVGHKFLNGDIKADKAIEELKALSDNNSAALLDVLFVVEHQAEAMGPKAKERLKELVSKLFAGTSVSETELKLNLSSFQDKLLDNRLIKTKTRLFYKQLKFNLLREESEGYAKLIVELGQKIDNQFNSVVALERIRSLIGQFNLDPNRVLDIILESFENRPSEEDFFISLIKFYKTSVEDTTNLMGFKFTFYRDWPGAKRREETPSSIHKVAALLIKNNLVDLLHLCTYLCPNTDWILDHNARIRDMGEKRYRKATAVLGAVDKVDPELNELEDDKICRNQKISLLVALLEVNDWLHAKQIFDRLPEFYAVRFPDVAEALCSFIDREINEFYLSVQRQFSLRSPTSERVVSSTLGVNSYETLVTNAFPVALYLGPYISARPVLVVKFVRLGVAYLSLKSSHPSALLDSLYGPVIDLCDEVLVPSISLMSCNCGVSEELWKLVSLFPYQIRYRFYGRWKSDHMAKHPDLVVTCGEVRAKTKYVMKRLSKETTKQAGRQLAKLCHTHPTVVFDYILNQIQQFENLIGPVVESLKFLTNLSYDALAYCVIEQLASPEKEKMKISDITLSPWLQSLATFVGVVFKKYSIELTGVLQYVANQLKAGKSYDLLVLREIIQNMSGVETTSGLTQEQLEALAGGDLLKQEGGYLSQVRNTKRSTSRLKEALLQEDLVVSLIILMAQQRGSIVFKEGTSVHLKLVVQMLDQCQETLVQFGNFLASNLRAEDYMKRMPQVDQLLTTYHLSGDAAFFLARPMYAHTIQSKYDELKRTADKSSSKTGDRKAGFYTTAYDFATKPLIEQLQGIYCQNKLWQAISPKFYVTFWTLSMYDLNVPTQSYEREIEKLRKQISLLDENKDLSDSKRRKEKERCQQYEAKLADEQRRQQEHVSRVMARLELEKDEWIPSDTKSNARSLSVSGFLQYCLLPRCIFTDMDALYCSKMFHVINQLGTPNFWTVFCYDRIFCDITQVIAGLSENEANHYGRFMCAMLDHIMRWYKDPALYQKDCGNSLGFARSYNIAVAAATAEQRAKEILNFDSFRHVVYKWHTKITFVISFLLQAFSFCLTSGQYVLIRNALIILRTILPVYPVITSNHEDIDKAVIKIRDDEKEKRQDLHVLAASYWGHLKVRKMPLINEEDFHTLDEKKKRMLLAQRAAAISSAKASLNAEDSKRNTPANSAAATPTRVENNIEGSPSHSKQETQQKREESQGKKVSLDNSKAASTEVKVTTTASAGGSGSSVKANPTAAVSSTQKPTAAAKVTLRNTGAKSQSSIDVADGAKSLAKSSAGNTAIAGGETTTTQAVSSQKSTVPLPKTTTRTVVANPTSAPVSEVKEKPSGGPTATSKEESKVKKLGEETTPKAKSSPKTAAGGSKPVRKVTEAEIGPKSAESRHAATKELLDDPETAKLLDAVMATKKPRLDRSANNSSTSLSAVGQEKTNPTATAKGPGSDQPTPNVKSAGNSASDADIIHSPTKSTKTREAKRQTAGGGVNGDVVERKSRRTTIATPEDLEPKRRKVEASEKTNLTTGNTGEHRESSSRSSSTDRRHHSKEKNKATGHESDSRYSREVSQQLNKLTNVHSHSGAQRDNDEFLQHSATDRPTTTDSPKRKLDDLTAAGGPEVKKSRSPKTDGKGKEKEVGSRDHSRVSSRPADARTKGDQRDRSHERVKRH